MTEIKSGNKRASLRDVAKLAGVSVATASRVLSGADHPVSDDTRQSVVAAAERLDFEPNRLARALVTARSGVIGAIVHDISDPYFGDIVRGLEDGFEAHDYRILVASSDRDPRKELDYLKALIGQQVDGIILAASSLADRDYENRMIDAVARFRRQGGLVVLLSEHVVKAPRVVYDNVKAAEDMVTYLVDLGHRRIAYLAGPSNLSVAISRLDGYRQGLASAGISFDENLIGGGEFTIEGGGEAARRLLDATDFTALFTANDLMAIGAARALLDEGIQIPQDISVAGFDDISLAAYGPVPLTTVRMPTYDVGKCGADLMIALLGDEEPADVTVEGSIVERVSVGAPPS